MDKKTVVNGIWVRQEHEGSNVVSSSIDSDKYINTGYACIKSKDGRAFYADLWEDTDDFSNTLGETYIEYEVLLNLKSQLDIDHADNPDYIFGWTIGKMIKSANLEEWYVLYIEKPKLG